MTRHLCTYQGRNRTQASGSAVAGLTSWCQALSVRMIGVYPGDDDAATTVRLAHPVPATPTSRWGWARARRLRWGAAAMWVAAIVLGVGAVRGRAGR